MFHTRPTGTSAVAARGSSVRAWCSSVSSRSGLATEPDYQPGLLGQPGAEGLLAGAVLHIAEHARGTVGVLVDEEDEPRHPRVGRRLELQLGVGQRRVVAHR